MAKAYLTHFETRVDTEEYSIRDMNDRECSKIHGPVRYVHYVTYVSAETLIFPMEIEADDYSDNYKIANISVSVRKERPQVEPRKITVKNSIGQLEV